MSEHAPAISAQPATRARASRRLWLWLAMGAWGFLVAAMIHPAHGMGVPLCPSRFVTGIDCPGCGLTRSVSCAVRGELSSSWGYHPFGTPLTALAAGIAIVAILPARIRDGVARHVWKSRIGISRVGIVCGVMFVAFGVARMLGVVGRNV